MRKNVFAVLRWTCAVFAALFTVAAAMLLLLKLCFFNEARYAQKILVPEFYDTVVDARDKNLAALGSMIEVEEETLDRYASEEECKGLAEAYVKALLSDMFRGTHSLSAVEYRSDALLTFLKEDFRGYDFSQTSYGDSDGAAEAAYGMIRDAVNNAVCFLPSTVSTMLVKVSPVARLVDKLSAFWGGFLLIALAFYAFSALLKREGNAFSRLFSPAVALWCSAVLVAIPVAILFYSSNSNRLELDRDSLYYFLSGCVNAVRSVAIRAVTVLFVLASGVMAVVGIKATARVRYNEDGPALAEGPAEEKEE